MERGIRYCRVNAFCALLLVVFAWAPVTETVITCRSCHLLDKWSGRELLVRMDGGVDFGKVGDKNGDGSTALFNLAGAETGQPDCGAADNCERAHSVRKRNTDRLRSEKTPPDDKWMSMRINGKVYNLKHPGSQGSSPGEPHHRVRRSTQGPGSPPGARSPPALGNSTPRAARRVPRSDLRWNREERRAATSRQEELKLTSSTFALTGDSAHNQAMVHWSGQNSSVILMLTKLYDFNLGSVTESSLWRSTDYGTTYEKLNEKVGVKTILSYLYVSPNNKRKIMLLTDPEVESSLLISSDEGATYQKYRLNFYILSLLFHPEQEDWILAYGHDQKDLHVISTDENRVVAAVQEWNQNDTYNLYVSEAGGIYYTLALENVMSSMGPEGNVMIDLYEVAGIKGMFLANKKLNNEVKTYITYNKGRDWRLLQAPSADLRENRIHCMLPYCSLHLHLHVSANPYTSGNIASRESAPGIIVASGSIGAELTSSNVSMFITSDAGNTWRQIFDEEYSVLYLDQGGALVAIRHTPLPIRHLWLSFDEGRVWNKYSFTSSPLFVDGVLGEPVEETLIMTIFGHVSHRSEWQLVKIDFRSIFNRRCIESDYVPWDLHDQGERCLMGVKRVYRKLKPIARCVMGKTYSVTMISEPCDCTGSDFECDYGFERRADGKCTPAFWFLPSSVSRTCTTEHTFLNSTGYRKVVSNNCTGGVMEQYTARRQLCPSQAPRGLHLVTSEGKLTATLANNVTFLVFLEEGDGSKTSITVDFGDGNAFTYSNVSSIEDGIKHIYKNVGIYRVSATAENSLGSETVLLFLHITCQLESIHLSAPFVAVKNKEVNLTVVLSPSQVGTVTYIWWFGNNSEPVITLEGSVAFTFSREGISVVTVQVSAGNTILQDRKTIAVHEYFRSHLLAFSSNLDDHNPDVAEWRLDVSRVIKASMMQATGVNPEQLLVTVLPGLPTAAEFFLLPDKQLTEGKPDKTATHLDQLSELVLSALNQNLVQFTLRPGVQITVYAAHLSAAPLVDTSENHSGSAMLMLLSVVVVGLAVFLIYKFKRKIPGLHVYAAMQDEKEQEMIQSPVSPTDSTPSCSSQRELLTSLEPLDTEPNTQTIECINPHPRVKFSSDLPTYIDV
ncbi:VPS10 domain-containing receptor SorCS1 isoform X3 [Puntigrus tetrazona]|uniref:VPS10 domain-containing receptor SorCS1 isoform X3 n=1 Tax=Puntigrus tetrazona TaxID=1606681 RepID=UPI001C8A5275|nr:VPS10 domain-containing receptor SorCS1 isoform X3 [Puntigrus tetrazona]